MIEKQKTKAIAAKYQKARWEISLFKKEKKNYKNDIVDETDPDQVGNNKYLLNFEKNGWEKLQAIKVVYILWVVINFIYRQESSLPSILY